MSEQWLCPVSLAGHGSCPPAIRTFHVESSDLLGAEPTEPLENVENKAGVTELKPWSCFLSAVITVQLMKLQTAC